MPVDQWNERAPTNQALVLESSREAIDHIGMIIQSIRSDVITSKGDSYAFAPSFG
jgi:hypothetical protein